MRKTTLSVFMLLVCGLATSLSAQTGETSERRWVGWEFQGENDAIALFSGSDEHYTNGLRFAMVRNPDLNPSRVERFGEWYRQRFFKSSIGTIFGWSIGQNLYTPEDIDVAALIQDDRPYAGVLYGSVFASFVDVLGTRKQTIELQFGFVGPEAGGEFVQRELHELIEDEPPLGWNNELGFEPIVNLNFRQEKRWILAGRRGPELAVVDVVPHWGFAAGNLTIRANLGGTLRLGKNVGGFPQPEIANTVVARRRQETPSFEGYVFVGVEGRAVLHNLLLDGNTFKDSHEVDKRTGVYDLRAGFFLRWRSWQFNYAFVRRSREFDPAQGEDEGKHDFGSITISRVFLLGG